MISQVGLQSHYKVECMAHFHANGEKCLEHGKCGRHVHAKVKLWEAMFKNLVVTTGLNIVLDNTFNAVAGNVNWYVGLLGAGTGTIAITTGTNTVTGTTTTFDAGLAVAPIADITIVGAGAAGVDHVTTVASRSSNTAITLTANAGTTVSTAAFATEPIAADTMASHINSWSDTAPYSNGTRPAWTKNGAAAAGATSNSSSKASFTINTSGRIFGAFLVNDNTKSGTTGTLYGGGLFSSGSRTVQNGDTLNVQIDISATAV